MKRLTHLAVLIALLACNFNPDAEVAIAAAQLLSRQYASRELRIDAAGHDCRILLVDTNATFDPKMIESLHYGTGDHHEYDGGIQQFAEDEKFRAVVYRDTSGGVWTYGATTLDEAKELQPCG